MIVRTIITAVAILLSPIALMAQANANALLDAYLPVKDALVRSAAPEAARHGSAMLKVLEAQPSFPEQAALARSVRQLAQADDLEKQRAAFADVSVQLWTMLNRTDAPSRDLYYAYCPMEKAYWISGEAAIRNPYYGAKMLTCGKVAEKRLR